MHDTPLTSQKGFSILMALGSTGVLLVIVVGMASVFFSEMRLSRLQYDSILSSTQAEGAFEYAMLKIRNHRDGFQDKMKSSSPDALIFSGASPRTDKVRVDYTIVSQSTDYSFSGGNNTYTIIPLFTGDCSISMYLDSSNSSCSPEAYTGTTGVQFIDLTTTGNRDDISWSIIAMSGSENISISGTGVIDGSESGLMRIQGISCYDLDGNEMLPIVLNPDGSCPAPYNETNSGQSLPYFVDLVGTTDEFLNGGGLFAGIEVKDPYLLIFSAGVAADITLKTDLPFTLPKMQVTTEAQKGNALQSIRFTEDKSRYYDALKYGIYNTTP